jgi:hypothetical protein
MNEQLKTEGFGYTFDRNTGEKIEVDRMTSEQFRQYLEKNKALSPLGKIEHYFESGASFFRTLEDLQKWIALMKGSAQIDAERVKSTPSSYLMKQPAREYAGLNESTKLDCMTGWGKRANPESYHLEVLASSRQKVGPHD